MVSTLCSRDRATSSSSTLLSSSTLWHHLHLVGAAFCVLALASPISAFPFLSKRVMLSLSLLSLSYDNLTHHHHHFSIMAFKFYIVLLQHRTTTAHRGEEGFEAKCRCRKLWSRNGNGSSLGRVFSYPDLARLLNRFFLGTQTHSIEPRGPHKPRPARPPQGPIFNP